MQKGQILWKMLGLSIAMVLGGSGALLFGFETFGGVLRSGMPTAVAAALMTGCLLLALLCLLRLLALNRQYLEGVKREVLDHPERILLRWNDEQNGHEIVLADNAILIGDAVHEFDAFGSTLVDLSWQPPTLRLKIRRGVGSRRFTNDIEVAVPPRTATN